MNKKAAIRAAIQSEADGLDIGERSARQVCPFCSGGNSGEASFSFIKHENAILYNCFRASCGQRGAIGYYDAVKTERKPFKKKKAKVFTGTLTELPENYRRFFKAKFGLTNETLDAWDIRWSPSHQRVWFPARDERGYDIGGMARLYTPTDFAEQDLIGGCSRKGSKALSYPDETNVPFMSWYQRDKESTHVLVEDSVSALKVWQAGLSCIALHGTHLSTEAALYLAERVTRVAIALDQDATQTAVKLYRKIGVLFESCTWVPLFRDLKYEDEETIRGMF